MTLVTSGKFRARFAGLAFAALAALASPALADEPTQAHLDLAAKLLTDVGIKSTVDGLSNALLAEFERGVTPTHPEMRTAIHEALVAAQPEVIKSLVPVFADVVHVTAVRMNEQQLKDSITYFESEAGKKYLENQTPVLAELNVSFGAWRQKAQQDLLARVREDLKKKGFEF